MIQPKEDPDKEPKDSFAQGYIDDLFQRAKENASTIAKEELEKLVIKKRVLTGTGQAVPKEFSEHMASRLNTNVDLISAVEGNVGFGNYADGWVKRKNDLGLDDKDWSKVHKGKSRSKIV
ncbi:MAG: hypothetical protein WC838_07100 [Candidatus Margulisiibacteriota bacterium]|jgi:hypothetical protein